MCTCWNWKNKNKPMPKLAEEKRITKIGEEMNKIEVQKPSKGSM